MLGRAVRTLGCGNGDRSVTATGDASPPGMVRSQLCASEDYLLTLRWSPDGERIALSAVTAATPEFIIQIWTPGEDEPRTVITGHNNFVRALEWSPDGSCLLAGD